MISLVSLAQPVAMANWGPNSQQWQANDCYYWERSGRLLLREVLKDDGSQEEYFRDEKANTGPLTNRYNFFEGNSEVLDSLIQIGALGWWS